MISNPEVVLPGSSRNTWQSWPKMQREFLGFGPSKQQNSGVGRKNSDAKESSESVSSDTLTKSASAAQDSDSEQFSWHSQPELTVQDWQPELSEPTSH